MFVVMRFREVKGHWPLRKPPGPVPDTVSVSDHSSDRQGKAVVEEKTSTAA
jgi:hypothetical protein